MERWIKLNEEIAVGGKPDRDDLEALRRDGFRSIVHLRKGGHENSERDEARRLGMKYAHVALAGDTLDERMADRLAVVWTSLEKPVFVHGGDIGRLERFVRRYLERRIRADGNGAAAATVLNEWLDRLGEVARAGRVAATSAGAGRGRNYAYLQYRTHDRRHGVVVVRPEGDGPHLRAFTFEDEPDAEIADLVDRVTHPPAVAS